MPDLIVVKENSLGNYFGAKVSVGLAVSEKQQAQGFDRVSWTVSRSYYKDEDILFLTVEASQRYGRLNGFDNCSLRVFRHDIPTKHNNFLSLETSEQLPYELGRYFRNLKWSDQQIIAEVIHPFWAGMMLGQFIVSSASEKESIRNYIKKSGSKPPAVMDYNGQILKLPVLDRNLNFVNSIGCTYLRSAVEVMSI